MARYNRYRRNPPRNRRNPPRRRRMIEVWEEPKRWGGTFACQPEKCIHPLFQEATEYLQENKNKSIRSAAHAFGVNESSLRVHLAGYHPKDLFRGCKQDKCIHPKYREAVKYLQQNRYVNFNEVARMFSVAANILRSHIKRRHPQLLLTEEERQKLEEEKKELFLSYYHQTGSQETARKAVGIGQPKARRWLIEEGLIQELAEEEKRELVLENYLITGRIDSAARAGGIGFYTAKEWLKEELEKKALNCTKTKCIHPNFQVALEYLQKHPKALTQPTAKKYRLHPASFSAHLKNYHPQELEKRRKKDSQCSKKICRDTKYKDAVEYLQQHADAGITPTAKVFDVDKTSLRQHLKKYHPQEADKRSSRRGEEAEAFHQKVVELYKIHGDPNAVANLLGVTRSYVLRFIKEERIKKQRQAVLENYREFGNITSAARAGKVGNTKAKEWLAEEGLYQAEVTTKEEKRQAVLENYKQSRTIGRAARAAKVDHETAKRWLAEEGVLLPTKEARKLRKRELKPSTSARQKQTKETQLQKTFERLRIFISDSGGYVTGNQLREFFNIKSLDKIKPYLWDKSLLKIGRGTATRYYLPDYYQQECDDLQEFINNNGGCVSKQQIKNYFQLTRDQVTAKLEQLIESGQIKQVGNRKTAKYCLVEYKAVSEIERIRQFLEKQGGCAKFHELKNLLGLSSATIGNRLNRYIQKGYLQRAGKSRTSRYCLDTIKTETDIEKLYKLLKEKDCASFKQIMEHLELSKSAVEKRIKAWLKTYQIKAVGGRYNKVYCLPDRDPPHLKKIKRFIEEKGGCVNGKQFDGFYNLAGSKAAKRAKRKIIADRLIQAGIIKQYGIAQNVKYCLGEISDPDEEKIIKAQELLDTCDSRIFSRGVISMKALARLVGMPSRRLADKVEIPECKSYVDPRREKAIKLYQQGVPKKQIQKRLHIGEPNLNEWLRAVKSR